MLDFSAWSRFFSDFGTSYQYHFFFMGKGLDFFFTSRVCFDSHLSHNSLKVSLCQCMGAVFHINGAAVCCFFGDNSVWLRSAHSLHGNNLFICEIALCSPPPAVIPKHHGIVSLCILNMLSVFLWTCEMSVKSLTIWLTVWIVDLAKNDSNPLLKDALGAFVNAE